MAQVLTGTIANPEEAIDDYISLWHSQEGEVPSLHSWLGMTWEEYALWVERPELLNSIILARYQQLTISKFKVVNHTALSKLLIFLSITFIGGTLGVALGDDQTALAALCSVILGWVLGSLYGEQ